MVNHGWSWNSMWTYLFEKEFADSKCSPRLVSHATAEDHSQYRARLTRDSSQHARRPVETQTIDANKAVSAERFMCVVNFPWLDQISGKLEWGLNCVGCAFSTHYRSDGRLNFRRTYAIEGYLAHIRELKCHNSIKLLESLI